MKIIGDSLADRVKYARSQIGLTQQELADNSHIPMSTIQSIEYGNTKNPGYSHMLALCRVFRVSVETLAGEPPIITSIEPPAVVEPAVLDKIKAAAREGAASVQSEDPRKRALISWIVRLDEPDLSALIRTLEEGFGFNESEAVAQAKTLVPKR